MECKPSELTFTPYNLKILWFTYLQIYFHYLQGDGQVGQMLCEHSGISKISLTGSVPVGVKVLQSCAKVDNCNNDLEKEFF